MLRAIIIYLLILLVTLATDIHLWVAQQLFDLQGQQWLLRDYWLTEDLLHRGVRNINSVVVALLLLAISWRLAIDGLTELNQRRLRLVAALLASFAVISYLKYVLQMDCPWDMQLYGGNKPYYPLWAIKPNHISGGRCFPAGHASIGFAYIALYFYWQPLRPVAAKIALTSALTLGALLGFVQQLRGAHFFIDDLTTAVICAIVSWLIFREPDYAHNKNNL